MYCTNCGKLLEGEAKLCKECEAALNGVTPPANDGVPPTNQPNQTEYNPYTSVPPYTQNPQGDQTPPYNPYPPYQNGTYYGQQGYYPPQPDPYYYSTEPEPQNRMFGFGKALTSVILAFVGYFFAIISLSAAMAEEGGAGLVITMITLGILIPAFIFGLRSIQSFKRRKATCVKNVPTFVLGIVGLSFSSFDLFFTLIAFLVSLVML